MSESDNEFVQKLDRRLGLYVGGYFEERQEWDEMVSAPKYARLMSLAEVEAAPAVTHTPHMSLCIARLRLLSAIC